MGAACALWHQQRQVQMEPCPRPCKSCSSFKDNQPTWPADTCTHALLSKHLLSTWCMLARSPHQGQVATVCPSQEHSLEGKAARSTAGQEWWGVGGGAGFRQPRKPLTHTGKSREASGNSDFQSGTKGQVEVAQTTGGSCLGLAGSFAAHLTSPLLIHIQCTVSACSTPVEGDDCFPSGR